MTKGALNMEMTYTMRGDYLLPDLTLPSQPSIGKYGMLRKSFLKEHRKATYTSLLLSGKLMEHLAEIDRTARERVERMTAQMAGMEGVNEEMKSADPMKWVGLMNNLKHSAEETVLTELIYN
ncbi:hypothetical protein SDC9_153140 [bioreactor metagenome]|uniref:TnpV protein n=1 Tax=bioreactor metagenome TaxID=1076179 RepID=A0A645EWS3_9ZZZZ